MFKGEEDEKQIFKLQFDDTGDMRITFLVKNLYGNSNPVNLQLRKNKEEEQNLFNKIFAK